MRSEKFRPRFIAIVALALGISLISDAALATQINRKDKKQHAKTLRAKAAPVASGKKEESKSVTKKQGDATPDNVKDKDKSAGEKPERGTPAKEKEKEKSAGEKQGGGSPEEAADQDPCETVDGAKEGTAGLRVGLFYAREATKIAEILNAVAKPKGSDLHCLSVAAASDNEIILYGPKDKRDHARRVIAALDLPRPGINMEMWGIQISSGHPDKMAIVLPAIREEINRTQQAVRGIYVLMQRLGQRISELDVDFKTSIVTTLGYKSALDASRPLSLTDILLRMVAAQNPLKETGDMARELDRRYRAIAADLEKAHHNSLERLLSPKKPKKTKGEENATASIGRPAFESFFRLRGMSYERDGWVDNEGAVEESALMARMALLDFGLHYSRLVHEPRCFSSYYLQQSAETLNSRLQAAIDALNLDMQRMFIEPTLLRIQEIVRNFDEVEYAQVGKTSVASLSGVTTEVTSHSVSAFDVTPPLRLSELLDKAKTLSDKTSPFIPKETKPGATEATELTAGALPISQVIGLIGALGEERSVWRELQSGISLTITPNVLRNMTSAELQIDLKTGDPQAGTREEGVRPLSRVSQHDVKTSVYVNALDFFDLSAFISQSTLNGGRGYVPIIGPVWRGLFSDVPGIGKLFSWQKPPQTVYHESLVLTNSFITPTAMGIALLYPVDVKYAGCSGEENSDSPKCDDKEFDCREGRIEEYKNTLRQRIRDIRPAGPR